MFNKLFRTKYRCYAIDHQVETEGYLDKEHHRVQYFEKIILLFGIIPVYFKVLFKEHVPNWAWIQWGCCGWCEWHSDCPADIWKLCTGTDKG